MNLPTVTELVKDNFAHFDFYRSGELWYHVWYYLPQDTNSLRFEFPVPTNDTNDGVFLASDKAIYFMRWIRKHLEMLQKAQEEHNQ